MTSILTSNRNALLHYKRPIFRVLPVYARTTACPIVVMIMTSLFLHNANSNDNELTVMIPALCYTVFIVDGQTCE